MVKKLICLITFLNLTISTFAFSAQQHHHQYVQFGSCSPRARDAVNALNKLPEFRELLSRVQKEGPVHVRVQPDPNKFEGLWEGGSRMIIVNSNTLRSHGQMICTILFELHNAATDSYYEQLIYQASHNQLTKDQYVEKVERAEYENAKSTYHLLCKGIEMGIFPRSSAWPVSKTFEEHYKIQQVSGHSLWIANFYNHINPRGRNQKYYGTIARPSHLNPQEVDEMCKYICMRSHLESDDLAESQMGKNQLGYEIAHLRKHHRGNQRKGQLMHMALQGNPDYEHLIRIS